MVAVIALLALALGCGSEPAQADADGDGDGVPRTRDCDDPNPRVHPGAVETCDGIDQDCDGIVDDGVTVTAWYRDVDGDGWGEERGRAFACAAPAGFVAETGDRDDGVASIAPDGEDADCVGIDQDCDGRDGPCVDLGTTVVLQGSTPRELAGYSVAGVGDLDGDGYEDALIGAPTRDSHVSCRGADWLLRGGPAPAAGDLAGVASLIKNDLAGWSVAAAGDVDGEDLADLLMGAPSADLGGDDAGAAYFALGSSLW
ncbi:MAG: MopE-related protein [Pseudomonadota bacterium]